MLYNQLALRILESPEIDAKLSPPGESLSDERRPGHAPRSPARTPQLRIVPGRLAPVPKLIGWGDPSVRRRVLHALANHELQAVELYAWALLRFPDAPAAFRRDLARVLVEEQAHARHYLETLARAGMEFGERPVSGYFWGKSHHLGTPLRFVSAMALTFENANLDHSLEARDVARSHGDDEAVALFERIHRDEIGHVAFGWRWLLSLAPAGSSPWETYVSSLTPPLDPSRASGRCFRREPRLRAGLTPAFVDRLEHAHAAASAAP